MAHRVAFKNVTKQNRGVGLEMRNNGGNDIHSSTKATLQTARQLYRMGRGQKRAHLAAG